MKIALNATCFNDRPSGARQRFIGIYGEVIKQMPKAEFVIYEPVDCRVAEWFSGLPNISARVTSIPSEGRIKKHVNVIWDWHKLLKNEKFDLFERFNLPIVTVREGKVLMTIHDIRGVNSPDVSLKRLVKKSYIGQSLKAADRVITVSNAMKEEIESCFPGTPISVIYNGLDLKEFGSIAETDLMAFKKRSALPEGYVLAVGHFETRKNYLRLIEAIALLRDRGNACPLLIIGNDSREKKLVEECIEANNLGNTVKVLSGLTNQEVRNAYQLCGLFVFPSLYEGFGIPILEAMAAGRPMILSELPVFREITENKGIYFPPDNVGAIADAIEFGLSSSDERDRIVNYGNRRINDFGFPALARQISRVYENVL